MSYDGKPSLNRWSGVRDVWLAAKNSALALGVRYWTVAATIHFATLVLVVHPPWWAATIYVGAALMCLVLPFVWLSDTARAITQIAVLGAIGIRTIRTATVWTLSTLWGVENPAVVPPPSITGNLLLVMAVFLTFELSDKWLSDSQTRLKQPEDH